MASACGIGFLPRGGATVASFTAAAVFLRLRPSVPKQGLLIVGAVVAGQLCARRLVNPDTPDPHWVVIDEIAGVWLALLGSPLDSTSCAAGAVLFRALDRFKPWPVSIAHEDGGRWRLMADDVVAGAMANALLRIWSLSDGLG